MWCLNILHFANKNSQHWTEIEFRDIMIECSTWYCKTQITIGLIEREIMHLNWKWKALVYYFRHDQNCLSQILLETVLTVITCQFLNHELQIPAALCLACHILFRPCALTVTVICLQCVQMLYKAPWSRIAEIKTFLGNKTWERNNFVSVLFVKECCAFMVSLILIRPYFIFRSWEDPCNVMFVLTRPAVQHQAMFQRGFDASGLLWGGCKSLQSHKPGVYMNWQLASQLHKMSSPWRLLKAFEALFYLSN